MFPWQHVTIHMAVIDCWAAETGDYKLNKIQKDTIESVFNYTAHDACAVSIVTMIVHTIRYAVQIILLQNVGDDMNDIHVDQRVLLFCLLLFVSRL